MQSEACPSNSNSFSLHAAGLFTKGYTLILCAKALVLNPEQS